MSRGKASCRYTQVFGGASVQPSGAWAAGAAAGAANAAPPLASHPPRLRSACAPFCRRYVPFGRVEEVLPYLIRRAQENSAILAGEAVAGEMKMLRAELKRRLGLTLQPPLPEDQ